MHIEHILKSLGQHDTIEYLGRKMVSLREIADEGGARIATINVKNIALRDTSFTVLIRVSVIADLEHPPFDAFRVAGQEIFDVATVHGLAAIEAKVWTDWAQPPQVAKPNGFTPSGR